MHLITTQTAVSPDTAPPPDGAAETVEPAAAAKADVATLKPHDEVMNGGDIANAATFYAPDTRNHGKVVGRAGLTRVLTDLRTMFPDYRHELFEIAATQDVVVDRNRVTGTHKGVDRIPSRTECWSAWHQRAENSACNTSLGGAQIRPDRRALCLSGRSGFDK